MVLRLLVGVLMLIHGFVHLRLWLWGIGETLDPHHSWLTSDARSVSIALAVLAGVTLGSRASWPLPGRTGGLP